MRLMSLAITATLGALPAAAEPRALEASFRDHVKPFLRQYCERCHNAEKLSSGIRVDHLDASLDDKRRKLWEELRKEIDGGAMPPEGEKQPTKEERRRLVEWVTQALDVARSRPTPKNGGVRRLTVAQYRNTLRELLLLDENLTDILPPDAVSKDGFVNNQSTLQLSPLLLEAYFEIAEKALARSVVDPGSKPTIQNFRVELGAGVNPKPFPEQLILGADSLLLKNADFLVTEPKPAKPFDFAPFAVRTKYRYIEGYQGNDTVRGWRDYDSVSHAVFACMRGAHGYPKGQAYSAVPQGLLLRPAIPSAEIFGVDSTYGPKANFKIALRELPDHGRFRVTVTAAKYGDGLLLDPGAAAQPLDGAKAVICRDASTVTIPEAGVYQVDVHAPESKTPAEPATKPRAKPQELNLTLGDRAFTGTLHEPAFLVVRLPAGALPVKAQAGGRAGNVVFTPLADTHEAAKRFADFEKRTPLVGVHMGFRRDCGSTLAPVGSPQAVPSDKPTRFVFEGSIRNFPSPDVEKDNVNYLAGVREIGVRSEYTHGHDMPRLLIQSVEFEGPYFETWPPPAHRNIFIDSDRKDDAPAYARQIIRSFATRAYRRPVTAPEEAALMAVFDTAVKSGRDFRDSIKDALLVVLTSPQFLFLTETSLTPAAEPLDAAELASKLSYFLWNGPPDAGTLKLAAAGDLRKSLDAEVARLVADPKFSQFVNEFAAQWLALDKFQTLEPDRKQFPKLTRDTRAQLRREPVEYLHHMVRNNLPVKYLIESDFVLANEVTAGYYDLAGKTDRGFEFVPVKHTRPELGGLLSQAAILAGLSDGRESNPIKRGAWLARRIIAEPPDDPPPNVPALKETQKNLTLRARLEQHRSQKGCVQCHTKIDPWGVPFEEFDAGGRFKTAKVDAKSILPDKATVSGFAELKNHLATDRIDQVAFSVLTHLATYACGRSLTYNELDYLRKQGTTLKADGYRMQDMIRFVVASPIFLEK